jgi:hypothetical protein
MQNFVNESRKPVSLLQIASAFCKKRSVKQVKQEHDKDSDTESSNKEQHSYAQLARMQSSAKNRKTEIKQPDLGMK